MLIAQQKRKENIAEYLLYLWQVEDLIRACNLDIDTIDRQIVGRFEADEATRAEIRDWYESLLMMMQHEHIKEKGHLQISKNVIIRLTDLHRQLLASDKFPQYRAEYYQTLPVIVELRSRQPEDERDDELTTCFDALYGVMMLRLQGKEISEGTSKAINQIAHFIGTLAAYFKKDEEKPIFEDDDIS